MRFFAVIFLILAYCNIGFAAKQEWVDKKYNFQNIKKIYLAFAVDESIKNGISEKEAKEIYEEKMLHKLRDKLSAKGYVIQDRDDAVQDFNAAKPEGHADTDELERYLHDNFDAFVDIKVQKYQIGYQYAEGYLYTVPRFETQTVYTSKGPVIVTSQHDDVRHVPGGNFPTVFVMVRFDVYDNKTSEAVWSRIDDRSRMNRDGLDNSKPKDVFGRIIKDFTHDLRKRLEKD